MFSAARPGLDPLSGAGSALRSSATLALRAGGSGSDRPVRAASRLRFCARDRRPRAPSPRARHDRRRSARRRSPAHARRPRRCVGMVFQDYALFPHLSVARNVAFGIAARFAPAERRAARAAGARSGRLGARPSRTTNCRGQQQRVASGARPRATAAALLLLDEPFSSLDVDLRERLAQELRAILKASATTALFVTHDQIEAFAVGDKIGIMNEAGCCSGTSPTRCTTGRRTASSPSSSVTASSRRRRSSGLAPARWCGPRSATSSTRPSARCPGVSRTGFATCCCAPTTSCTTTPPRCRPASSAKPSAAPTSSTTLRLASGERLQALVPSHHDHQVGEWIGIRAEVDHVVTFAREPAARPTAPLADPAAAYL